MDDDIMLCVISYGFSDASIASLKPDPSLGQSTKADQTKSSPCLCKSG